MIERKRYLLRNEIAIKPIDMTSPAEPRRGRSHWVSVRAPAESRLPIEEDILFEHLDIEYMLERDRNGLLCSIRASCKTDARAVPRLLPATAPGSRWNFAEPPDENREKLLERLCRLEGVFSLIGQITFDLRRLEWTWFEENDQSEREILVSTTLDFEPNKIKRPALSGTELASLAKRAIDGDSQTLMTINLFKTGEDNFQNYRYQESLRFFLLALEHEFSGGKFRTADTEKNYLKENRLISAIAQADKYALQFSVTGDIQRETIRDILETKSSGEIVRWLVGLRGYLFHQSSKRKATWHPSLHIPHKEEAILVRSILEPVIITLVRGAQNP